MGRGRAKAKQTKVARQLKYNSGRTDLSRLAEELGAGASKPDQAPTNGERVEDDEELEDDLYARYAEMYNDEDDEEDGEEPYSNGHSSKRRGA
ncbi:MULTISPECIES: DUF3073 domain-containing protein [unclassified Streptomyces]|uniref:DUF3073 domain-containing protein n=1 Tax=Streptomyces millisiae TaxID=3075542 RepID=A0ABU2LUI9_9ACTN|nr:DUF3073 domain-containing protein [Streptomyces sp. DSM 44918]MDT0321265.1 DUF3073 domain-containing protein [Streptomyces sp. DSM 44918]